jgi:hypothetical protein
LLKLLEKAARAWLFLALTVWMVLAGTLLLETVATSFGMKTLMAAESMAPGVSPGWEGLFQPYRYAVSSIALLCGYHCFSGREWARKGILTLIILDLTVWTLSSVQNFVTLGGSGLDLSRMFIQVFVVLFEVGLFWLLLDDHIKGEFHRSKEGTPPTENERTH